MQPEAACEYQSLTERAERDVRGEDLRDLCSDFWSSGACLPPPQHMAATKFSSKLAQPRPNKKVRYRTT